MFNKTLFMNSIDMDPFNISLSQMKATSSKQYFYKIKKTIVLLKGTIPFPTELFF